MTEAEKVAARIAEDIRREAKRLSVNPHHIVDLAKGYVTLPAQEYRADLAAEVADALTPRSLR